MLVLFYLLLRILLVVAAITLVVSLFNRSKPSGILKTVTNGFRDALKRYGFLTPSTRYPVELYKWIVLDEDDVSEECLERSQWPAMDIADWMKAGLPNTPEGPCQRGKDCKCELILYKQTRYPEKSTS